MAITHIVRGKTINAAIIAGFANRMGKLDDTVTVWANAAVLEAASKSGNMNWVTSLFNVPMFRLADGKLSKSGKEVFAYVNAFYPWIEWNKVENKPVLKSKRNEGKAAESPLHTHFVAVGVTADNVGMQDDENVLQSGTKFYLPFGDFRLTFAEFKNLPKPEKDAKPDAGIKAAAFAKQVAKVLEAHKEQRFVGTAEELAAALTAVKELYAALNHQQTKAAQAAIENGDGVLYSVMPDAAARTDDVILKGEAA